MKEQTIIVRNSTGMHARPAKIFVTAAKQFKSDIRMFKDEKKANAKSLVSLLTLGVRCGQEVKLVVEGTDEEKALQDLIKLIESGMGEDVATPSESNENEEKPEQASTAKIKPISKESCESTISGIAAAPGIAIGPVFQYTQSSIEIEETFAGASEEQNKLQAAIEEARGQLQLLKNQMLPSAPEEEAIFDVHLELLDDPELIEAVLQKLENRQSAAQAWQSTIEERVASLKKVDDPLLAARTADLHDISYRVLRIISGSGEHHLSLPDYPVILIADDLSPSDTATLDKKKVLGICTASGGPTAHSAIIARALGIPAVVGAGRETLTLKADSKVILDGDHGNLHISPDKNAVAQAKQAIKQNLEQLEAAEKKAMEPAVTLDGHTVEIAANIGGLKDAKNAYQHGAEGIGLLRTEFLFLDRSEPPTEEEQFEVYKDIIQAMQGRPVIIRTLDIGGDKPLPYLDLPPEDNPFLGERGIRLCLNRPELLKQQLQAILRASAFGPIRIMFPMVSDLAEWKQARGMVTEICEKQSIKVVECGIMIEVPSAALMADVFAPEVDFFSVGTNDLTQYTLAMDRMHPSLSKLSDGLHPAVLRLIKNTVDAAHANGKWVGVCGELGSDQLAVPILTGLGVDELSVSVPMVARVKESIRTINCKDSKNLAQKAIACKTASDVRKLKPTN
ncbi:MAG: phosphoenolpyruvate--protein phosphotransferase [Proteobacteria bacterium]|nr:phosphoenolpyruvate--protein phosphotransferase [Pseudomonadota bacterium]